MTELLDGLATTRTIRRYTAEPVPESDLSTIMWHATRAPSGSNRQPVRYLVLRDDPVSVEARQLIAGAAQRVWAHKEQRDDYASGSGTVADSPKARMAATMQHYVEHFAKAPVVALVCMHRHRDPSPYEGASVYPAVQNLLLAARALGYGGAVTMFHLFVEAHLRSMLEVPDDVAMSACVTLGRPAGSHGPVRRRPAREVVFEGRWGANAAWVTEPQGARHTMWKQHEEGR